MGIRYTDLGDGYVQLEIDYKYWEEPNNYYDTDSIEEAIEYFHLNLDENTGLLRYEDKEIMSVLGLHNDEEIESFLAQLKKIGETLTEQEAINNEFLFLEWSPKQTYSTDDRVYYKDGVYKCLQDHTSHIENTPWDLHDCWKKMLPKSKTEEWYPNNNYANGDLVTYSGKTYQSLIDGNNLSPDNANYWGFIVEE